MSNIAGANSSTLLITQEYFGKFFRVGVSATNSSGTGTVAFSSIRSSAVLFPAQLFAGTGESGYQDGPGLTAQFGLIHGITSDGSNLFVTDNTNKRVRKIDSAGNVSTIAGTGAGSRTDGLATNATFNDIRSIAYGSGKLYIRDDSVFRVLDLATNQVTTMKNQAAPVSWSQSSTQVTLNFSKPHGFFSGNPIEVVGIHPNVDGVRTSIVSTSTPNVLKFNVVNSASVSTTALTGATATGDMGNPSLTTASEWFNYYKAFQVGLDGHLYLGRANSGETSTQYRLLRFRNISGDIFELDILGRHQICDFSFVSTTQAYVNTCGSTMLATTADDWASVTLEGTGINNNVAVLYTSGGYVYSGSKRLNLNNSPSTIDTVFNDSQRALVELNGNVYWTDISFYKFAVYEFLGGGTGVTPTQDLIPPALSSSVPADNSTSALTGSDIVLNFSENVAKGTGNVSIVRASDSSAQVIDVTSAAVSVAGSTVTINPPSDLDLNTDYYVLIDATAIVDLADTPNAFAGISSPTVLNFTTIAPPSVLSSIPADNALNVPNNSEIVLTFSRAVTGVTGKNITLVNLDTSATTVIAADDAQVSSSGSAITINLTTDLEISSNYAVTFEAGAFTDANGIGVNALSDQTVLNFKTAKIPFAGLELALDASIPASYSGTGDVWADISGNNNDLKLDALPSPNTNPKVLPTFNGVDKALVFDAAEGQYGFFWDGTNPTLDLLNEAEYTKLVWFKPTSLTNPNNLFSSALKSAHALWGGGLDPACTAGGGDNLASGHNGSWRTVQSGECLETEWQLVAVTFNSDPNSDSAGWRIFRNGSLVGTSADTAVITDGSNSTDNRMGYRTLIGSYNYGNFFDGQIGQVYLYGRALDATEINDVFEASATQYGLDLRTVTFNANGGTVDLASVKSNAGDGSVTLRTPNKTDGTFLGWYTQPSGGTRVGGAGETYVPASDVTLFAQWDNTFTVTFAAGTNATGAPASVQFRDSTGPVVLPTPNRADYEFNGWYTADTGGTKVGNAGDNFTPTSNVTLHGRWTQLSLAGVNPADLTNVNTETIIGGVGSVTTRTIGSSSVTLTVPANALPAGVVVRLYSVANHNKAQAILPNESDFVNSMVVAWSAPDTTVPVASQNLTMVIVDPNIKAGARVFSILGNQSTLLATATQDGTVTIAFDTDPLVTIANPVAAPPQQNNVGGGLPAEPEPELEAPDLLNQQQARAWTRYRASTDDLKIYARDIVGVGKVQFFLNGREIAWVRAGDANDPKLNVRSAPGEAADGMVRTVAVSELTFGRNIFEIHVQGERVVRRIYTR